LGNPDLKTELLQYLGEDWLQAPNSWFSGRKPVSLLGTSEEDRLRELLESILVGDFT
jgi:hypothetical protein